MKEIGSHNTDRSLREQLNYVYGMTVEELEDDGVIFPTAVMEDNMVGAFE